MQIQDIYLKGLLSDTHFWSNYVLVLHLLLVHFLHSLTVVD